VAQEAHRERVPFRERPSDLATDEAVYSQQSFSAEHAERQANQGKTCIPDSITMFHGSMSGAQRFYDARMLCMLVAAVNRIFDRVQGDTAFGRIWMRQVLFSLSYREFMLRVVPRDSAFPPAQRIEVRVTSIPRFAERFQSDAMSVNLSEI